MTNKCNDLGPRLAGLVQQMNTVHVLYQQGKAREANEKLADVQAQATIASRDLWLEYTTSGEVK